MVLFHLTCAKNECISHHTLGPLSQGKYVYHFVIQITKNSPKWNKKSKK